MRASSFAFALLAGIAAACVVGLFGADGLTMFQAGLGIACFAGALMVMLDWFDTASGRDAYRSQEYAKARQIDAETEMLLRTPPAPPAVAATALRANDEAADDADGALVDFLPTWRAEANKYVIGGALYGFKVRDIGAGEHQIIDWDEWGTMRDFLIEAGVLSPRGGTHFADNWSLERWQREYQTMPLPPVRTPPPVVKLTVNSAQKQRQQQEKQGGEVVEGVGRVTE